MRAGLQRQVDETLVRKALLVAQARAVALQPDAGVQALQKLAVQKNIQAVSTPEAHAKGHRPGRGQRVAQPDGGPFPLALGEGYHGGRLPLRAGPPQRPPVRLPGVSGGQRLRRRFRQRFRGLPDAPRDRLARLGLLLLPLPQRQPRRDERPGQRLPFHVEGKLRQRDRFVRLGHGQHFDGGRVQRGERREQQGGEEGERGFHSV